MRPWYTDKKHSRPQSGLRYVNQFSWDWGRGAPVVKYLIAINVGIWLIMVITSMSGWLDLENFWYANFAISPDGVIKKFKIYQLITCMFMHDGSSIMHLLMNMYGLWLFGARIERKFGSKLFLIFYLGTGIGGSLLTGVANIALGDWLTPMLGASAAVFGLLVAYGFLFSYESVKLFFVWTVKVWKMVVGIIIIETILLIFQLSGIGGFGDAQIGHWAHLGGALTACIWMLILLKRPVFRTNYPVIIAMPKGRVVSSTSRPPGKLFKVIVHNQEPEIIEHPEGTDDEPPPDWFKLD